MRIAPLLLIFAFSNPHLALHAQDAPYMLHFGRTPGAVRLMDAAPKSAPFGLGFWLRHKQAVSRPVHLVSCGGAAGAGAEKRTGKGKGTGAGKDTGSFFVGFENAARIRFGVRNAAGVVASVGGRIPRADGAWHHVAASFDGSMLAIWLDGKELERRELQDFGALANTKRDVIVGPVSTNHAKRAAVFPGQIAELRIFSRGRAKREIDSFRSAPETANRAGLELEVTLRAEALRATVRDTRDREHRIDDALARAGWCIPPTMPRAPKPPTPRNNPALFDLHCIDLDDVLGNARTILVSRGKKGREEPGVLWQDRDGRVRLTWVAFDGARQLTEFVEGKGVLAAGTTDDRGHCYTLRIEGKARNRPESDAVLAHLHRHVSAKGGTKSRKKPPQAHRAIDTTRGAFNLWSYGGRWHGNMVYSKGTLGLVLPRTMYRSRDGLRHQSAIAVMFSAKTLDVTRMLGTTSSHSMGNILTLGAKGDFLALDLGDNYPRGLHLHRLTSSSKASQVVFTYKTAHATRARNGSPRYEEISKDGKVFYKWSNDNATYSELGAVVERRSHYEVIFSTDRSVEGRVLDNSRAFRGCDDPRNLALLRVRKALGKGRGSVIADSVMASLPKGSKAEEGGFFDFSGRWSAQRVPGVFWLTDYGPGESAHAPQACEREDGSLLVLWEKRSDQGRTLEALEIDKKGRWGAPRSIPVALRFAREERMLRIGDTICVLAKDANDDRTRLYYVRD